jgi:hypothetical protein
VVLGPEVLARSDPVQREVVLDEAERLHLLDDVAELALRVGVLVQPRVRQFS